MPSSYVSGRVMSDQTEHSRAIIVGYVPSGHYFSVQIWPGWMKSPLKTARLGGTVSIALPRRLLLR
jgi:hypothetical protein